LIVARIKSEMEKIKQVGFTGTLIEFFDYVRNKKELMHLQNQKK
jgi:hypothetical protein